MDLKTINEEFNNALDEIMFLASKLSNPYDRVRTLEWIRKITEHPKKKVRDAQYRNEYVQYLKIVLSPPANFVKPFNQPPPKTALTPFPELMGNLMSKDCEFLPKTGKLEPVVCHNSEDHRSCVTVKRDPKTGNCYCYMAVMPK